MRGAWCVVRESYLLLPQTTTLLRLAGRPAASRHSGRYICLFFSLPLSPRPLIETGGRAACLGWGFGWHGLTFDSLSTAPLGDAGTRLIRLVEGNGLHMAKSSPSCQ